MKKALALLGGLVAFNVSAQVTILTDSRVEVLAVNQAINEVPKQGKGDLKIANGDNQLLLRVTALIDKNGGKERFTSVPIVAKFTANDQSLLFETPFAIRDERGVTKFEKSPSIKVTSNGQDVEIMTDLIYDQSFSLIKDYDAMLQGYNQVGGKAAIATASVTKKTTGAKVISQPQLQAESVTKTALQSDFLSMTPDQRQEFISWAVKHIND